MRRRLAAALLLAASPALVPAQRAPAAVTIDAAALVHDLDVLSADDMEGRKPGTAGHERARAYIARRFAAVGLEPAWRDSYEQPVKPGLTNVAGIVRGRRPLAAIAITAHYDHLGVRGGKVFNGANDNASGVAALIALASYFVRHPPDHTLVFAALDGEETGGHGARAFLDAPPVPRESIALDVNLDMLARDAKKTLYAVGTAHYPFLRPHLERVAARAPVELRLGHDGPGAPAIEDWTRESDHYAFHRRGIPFVYFGVEDPAEHHKETDEFASVMREFYVGAVETVLEAIRELDSASEAIERRRP